MANQRKKGTKLAGAFVEEDEDETLKWLAEQLGFPNKAAYLRDIYAREIEAKRGILARKNPKKK
jgi:hypothetical protein